MPEPRTSVLDPEFPDDPLDLVALQADDELINALASGMSISGTGGLDADDRLCAVLSAWKAEVDATPIPELVDLDTATAAVQAARRPSGRVRHLAPVAAAAAAMVALLGGVSLGSYSAEPNDVLWPVAKVLYSERTTSVEAANRVEQRIARAKQAIAAGQPAVAERELQAAAADLAAVRPQEGRVELAEVQQFLQAKAAETPPGVPTDPGAPLARDAARKVPPGAEMTSPARTSEQTSSPVEGPADQSGSPGPASAEGERPAAPEPADPGVARLPDSPEPAEADNEPQDAPAPADDGPADGPDSSDAPPEGAEPQGGEQVAPEPGPEPGASAPDDAPDGAQSIGATAADTGTAEPSPTS